MKNVVKKLIRGEQGAALILALVLLLVGGLIAAGLLQHMGAGLLSGEVYNRRTAELYAADAGVEDAVWRIQHPIEAGLPGCGTTWNYTYPKPGEPPFMVNGRSLVVTIYHLGAGAYNITSIAGTSDGGNTAAIGSATTVEAFVAPVSGNYSSITDHILTSQGELEWAKKVTLNYSDEENGPAQYYTDPWPTPEELARFYREDVENEEPYGSGTVDLNGVEMDLGPLYRNGTLEILNSSKDPVTVVLNGTIYITGDTLIGQNGKDFTLDLNGQTIFVSSNTGGNQKALVIGGQCIVKGPGAIIAVGDVYFAPKGDAGGNGKPVFIFSVRGTTQLQPSGDFYGAIAGSLWVDVQPGYTPTITYPPGGFGDEDLNFPGFGGTQLAYSIYSWEVSQQ